MQVLVIGGNRHGKTRELLKLANASGAKVITRADLKPHEPSISHHDWMHYPMRGIPMRNVDPGTVCLPNLGLFY